MRLAVEPEKELQGQARQFLCDVPRIKAVVFGDEGMGATRHGMNAWTRACTLLEMAFADVRPDFRTVAWRYTFRFRSPERDTWRQSMIEMDRMDKRIGYMSNFDGFWMRRRDGIFQDAYDYCLSLKAPAEDFRYAADFLAAAARQADRPPRPLWTHIETRFSQESNTQPEIPCMQRWAERFEAVNQFRPPIEGLIANWYHQGFYPTPVTELFGWMSYTGGPPTEDLLRAIARRGFWSRPGRRRIGCLARLLRGHLAFPVLLRLKRDDERRVGPAVLARSKDAESASVAAGVRQFAQGDGAFRRGRGPRQRTGKSWPAGRGAKALARRFAETPPGGRRRAAVCRGSGPRTNSAPPGRSATRST